MYDKRLAPDMNLNLYFTQQQYQLLQLGELAVPSGKIVAADPLYSLPYGGTPCFCRTIPSGHYPVIISVYTHRQYGSRYLAAKLQITNREAVAFELALKGAEEASQLEEDEIFGFPVETGLGCFCDANIQKEFRQYVENWRKTHPNANLYDDLLQKEFEKSYREKPKFQRSGGDWVNWNLPNTNHNIIMFNSGFGDGIYPCYWGFDKDREICSLIIQFIAPEELEE